MLNDVSGQTAALVRALRERHVRTGLHCDRTHGLAVELGRDLDLSQPELETLSIAAQLHDIGKIGIPDQVLLKPGRLDADELKIMKGHAQRGFDILIAVPDPGIDEIANIVLHHHERADGTGYPSGAAGKAIPLLSRVIALADSYDAMAEDRPYHAAKPHDVIMRILFEEEATRHDPVLRERFAAVVQTSPYRSSR